MDLLALYDWIAENASPDIALGYIERLTKYVRGFECASEREHYGTIFVRGYERSGSNVELRLLSMLLRAK